MSYSAQTLHYLNHARENGLLFAHRDAMPAILTAEQGGVKMYQVRGTPFHVPCYYETLSVVGHGAYGIVCAAVDLRLVHDAPFYDANRVRNEEEGRVVLRRWNEDGEAQFFTSRNFLRHPEGGAGVDAGAKPSVVEIPFSATVRAPSLLGEPYYRRLLPSKQRSPYVVIKKVPKVFDDLVDGRRILREIKVLRYLRGHPNIVRLENVMYPAGESKAEFTDIYMTMDMMDTDLAALLKSTQPIHEDQFRFIAYQMIKALVYIHSSGVIHRDMKPGNVLLNGDCETKICDFGLARGGVPLFQAPRRGENATTSASSGAVGLGHAVGATAGETPHEGGIEEEDALFAKYRFNAYASALAGPYGATLPKVPGHPDGASSGGGQCLYSLTDYVVTRHFRAPELLVMSRYNHAVDMWSVGCIMAGMITRRPIFPGVNYLSQLTLILETPGLRGLPQCASEVDELFVGGTEGKHFIKDILFHRTNGSASAGPRSSLTATGGGRDGVFRSALFGSSNIPKGAAVFISKLLHLNPLKRPTALEALRDPFFAPLYTPSDEVIRDSSLPDSEYLTPVQDPEKLSSYSVEDEPQPYMWEFDHRITDAESLHTLFCEEIDSYTR